jgi:hypothetical protein
VDQAYLRFSRAVRDRAPIVILGFFSENIVRSVSRDRGFRTNEPFALKPRFLLEDGALKLVPLPRLSEEEYASLRTRARELLPHDYFAPGGPSGVRSLAFPYSLAAAQTFWHYRIRARLAGRPSYAEFFEPDHPSGALPVTEAILLAFAKEARQRGQKPMVVMIPDAKDLEWVRARGALPYAELARRLQAAGVAVEDLADDFDRYLGRRAACEVYTRCDAGHFNPEGNRRFAEFVYRRLLQNGWIAGR